MKRNNSSFINKTTPKEIIQAYSELFSFIPEDEKKLSLLRQHCTDLDWFHCLQNVEIYYFLFEHFGKCKKFINRSVIDAIFTKKIAVLEFLWRKNSSYLHSGVTSVLVHLLSTSQPNPHFCFFDTMKILSSIGYSFKQDDEQVKNFVHSLLEKAYMYATTSDSFFFDLYFKELPLFCFKCGVKNVDKDNLIFDLYLKELKEKMFLICFGIVCETSPLSVLQDKDVLFLISNFL